VGACFFGKVPKILWVKTWKEVMDLLTEGWGDKARVAVYPDGTIQYFRTEDGKQ
jgi:hypothetical protein